jgi:hypothetical protein
MLMSGDKVPEDRVVGLGFAVVSGDLQPPDCLFKYAKPITADIHPLVEPHLNGC